jgi:methylaspartate mutase epsilon subunit
MTKRQSETGGKMEIRVANKRLEDDVLEKKRNEWLAEWPTGKEIDFEDAVAYQKSLPDTKIWWKVMARLNQDGRTVVSPRAGTGILENEIKLCRTIEKSGVPLIPVTTDSYSRSHKYEKARQALEESTRTGKSVLNGYPIAIQSLKNTRKIIESCDAAFSPRGVEGLSMELSIAAGMTASGMEIFPGFGSYSKNTTLEQAILNSQVNNRVCGWYADQGVILSMDLHGWIPSATVPLSINIVGQIIDAISAAEQGVKAFTPLIHFMGNMSQDLAWSLVSPRLIREYLDKCGYKDTFLTGRICQMIPLFPVPLDLGGAFAYINYSAMVASLAKAEALFVRTVDEGAGVATEETHAMSYRSAKWIFDVVREQKIEFNIKDIEIEEKITDAEVRAIVDKLFEIGDGDILVGAIKGIESGILDSPWSSNLHVKDEVLGVRDIRGACRYLDFGHLPIPDEIREFHREKVAEREKAQGKKVDYHTAVYDLWCFSKGKIVGLPPYDK